jgi:hypothetical protein
MTIVNDNSGVIIKWSFKLIDAAIAVIYDRHMFIVQATGERKCQNTKSNKLEFNVALSKEY